MNNNKLLFELPAYQDAQRITLKDFKVNDQNYYLNLKYSTHNNKFVCGHNATFGPVKRSENISIAAYLKLLESLYSFIYNHFDSFEVKLPPAYLDTITSNAFLSYFCKKKSKILIETNQYINVQEEHIFSKTNRKTLRRLQNSNCLVSFDKKISLAGYELLKRNRERRKVKLSLGYDDLVKQSEVMSERYIFVSCFDTNQKLIAYCICAKLQHNLLYVLYWGEEPNERSRSPVVLLCHALIDYAKEQCICYLDVGISSVDGKLDDTLFDFKKRLGCKSSDKIIISGQNA